MAVSFDQNFDSKGTARFIDTQFCRLSITLGGILSCTILIRNRQWVIDKPKLGIINLGGNQNVLTSKDTAKIYYTQFCRLSITHCDSLSKCIDKVSQWVIDSGKIGYNKSWRYPLMYNLVTSKDTANDLLITQIWVSITHCDILIKIIDIKGTAKIYYSGKIGYNKSWRYPLMSQFSDKKSQWVIDNPILPVSITHLAIL